jgi:hypothetical protein
MAGTEETRRAVGDAVKNERLRYKQSVEAAASIGKLSHMTWRRVEKGEVVQERSYSGIDKGLYVPAGTTLRAIQGDLDLAAIFEANRVQTRKLKELRRDRRILTEKMKSRPSDTALSAELARVNRELSEAEDEQSALTGYSMWEVRASKRALVEQILTGTDGGDSSLDDNPPDAAESDEVPAEADESFLPPGIRRGLAALLPPPGWKPSLLRPDRLAEDIVDHLPDLSISELDRVREAAVSVRRAKAVEILKAMDLLAPSQIGYPQLSEDVDPGVRTKLRRFSTDYTRAVEALLAAHERTSDARNTYARTPSPENQAAVERMEGEQNRTFAEARGLLVLYARTLDGLGVLKRSTDVEVVERESGIAQP